MKRQLLVSAALCATIAGGLTWLLGLDVHAQPFSDSLEAPASILVAAAAGAALGVALRLAVRETLGL